MFYGVIGLTRDAPVDGGSWAMDSGPAIPKAQLHTLTQGPFVVLSTYLFGSHSPPPPPNIY